MEYLGVILNKIKHNTVDCAGCFFDGKGMPCLSTQCSDINYHDCYIFEYVSGELETETTEKTKSKINKIEKQISEKMAKGRDEGGTAGALNRDIDNLGKTLDGLKARLLVNHIIKL